MTLMRDAHLTWNVVDESDDDDGDYDAEPHEHVWSARVEDGQTSSFDDENRGDLTEDDRLEHATVNHPLQ